jgi:iron complex outermembrane receptor protein
MVFGPSLFSQNQDTFLYITGDEIIFKEFKNENKKPWNVKRDTVEPIDIFQSNFDKLFNRLPGVLAINGENTAQDIRISMRGFGSRSAFGIRGIKMYLDGIPLTTPDGTTQTDELSIFNISAVSVLSSALSAHSGNSGGGTISLYTEPFEKKISVFSRINTLGAHDLAFQSGFSIKNVKNQISLFHHHFKSKRDHSFGLNSVLYNKTSFFIGKNLYSEVIIHGYYSPVGKDPGSLNRQDFENSPYQANPRNLQYNAGEKVNGINISLKTHFCPNQNLNLYSTIYHKTRDFEGYLPFRAGGITDLNRNVTGILNYLDYQGQKNLTFSFGQNFELQSDHRKRFANNEGIKGITDLHQKENVINFSLFQKLKFYTGAWSFYQLLRQDFYRYNLSDLFVADGLQDGKIWFGRVNGSVGSNYLINKNWYLFTNFATGFEVPTLNEFTNNPNQKPGFNSDLKPEKSVQCEAGTSINTQNYSFTSSIYLMFINDLITGFELEETPGRTYYKNASKMKRRGLELKGEYHFSSFLSFALLYDYSNFIFSKNTSQNTMTKGNSQPLIPKHKLVFISNISLKSCFTFSTHFVFQNPIPLNDENSEFSTSLWNINFSLSSGKRISRNVSFGLTTHNLFNTNPFSNFRANAASGRYFEAASPQHFSFFIRYNFLCKKA